MSIITVITPENRLTVEQRRRLAETLTDAVLEPELGQLLPSARIGFQVHFVERPADSLAIGGKLLIDQSPPKDVMLIHVTVMEGDWPNDLRERVIRGVLERFTEACGLPKPPPTWWVTFQVIDEGSWGSRGGVLSILQLLETGAFTSERAETIRRAIAPHYA